MFTFRCQGSFFQPLRLGFPQEKVRSVAVTLLRHEDNHVAGGAVLALTVPVLHQLIDHFELT